MIAFLSDNGWAFAATADEAEPVILQLAAGTLDKDAFTDRATKYMREKPRMELRDFFAAIHLQDVRDLAAATVAGRRPEEAEAGVGEGDRAIPLVRELAEYAAFAREQGHDGASSRM
jgi:hypothetical protein